jgi:hypothetical protein
MIASKPNRLSQSCHNTTDKNRGDITTGHMPWNGIPANYADRAKTG